MTKPSLPQVPTTTSIVAESERPSTHMIRGGSSDPHALTSVPAMSSAAILVRMT